MIALGGLATAANRAMTRAPSSAPQTGSTSQASIVQVPLPTPAPTTTPAPAPVVVGTPGPGGTPAPAGYTWVAGATVGGAWVAGHWARIGTEPAGAPTVPPRDHTAGSGGVASGDPSYLYGDPAIDAITPDAFRGDPTAYYKSRGLTDSQIAWINTQGADAHVFRNGTTFADNTIGGKDAAGVYIYRLTADNARDAAFNKWTPNQWLLEQWISAQTVDAAQKAATAAADAAAKKPPAPLPTTLPTSSTNKALIAAAAGAGLLYIMLGK